MTKESKFNKPLVMSKKDYEDCKKSTKCQICKKAYKEDEKKVKDHDIVWEGVSAPLLSFFIPSPFLPDSMMMHWNKGD